MKLPLKVRCTSIVFDADVTSTLCAREGHIYLRRMFFYSSFLFLIDAERTDLYSASSSRGHPILSLRLFLTTEEFWVS